MRRKWEPPVDVNDPKNAKLVEFARELRKEVRRQHGTGLTFEEVCDRAQELMSSTMWIAVNEELEDLVTEDDEIDIGGVGYRRLEQDSSAQYFGRWGSHKIHEPLYRQIGVHNGPTIKPIERRAGIIAGAMTPGLARVLGDLGAQGNSRQIVRTMRTTGMKPPSRSFVEKRLHQMAGEMAEVVEELEEFARGAESLPEIASVSCGMDRMSVRMCEPHSDPDNAPKPIRTEPYQRTPPPPKEHRHRMAWVGTATAYNKDGEPLHTSRFGAEADADPASVARRVIADIGHWVQERPDMPVNCVQDAAPELLILPRQLRASLPANTNIHELVDFEHLMKYLDKVVDACEPEDDPRNMKLWYRHELLRDDSAIERIERKLERLQQGLPENATDERCAVAAALSYICNRKDKMRYATYYAANLAIGSGATEGTCGLMQERVKRRGQSWEPDGLRAILTIRGLVLSERWDAAWQPYAAKHRSEVRCAA